MDKRIITSQDVVGVSGENVVLICPACKEKRGCVFNTKNKILYCFNCGSSGELLHMVFKEYYTQMYCAADGEEVDTPSVKKKREKNSPL